MGSDRLAGPAVSARRFFVEQAQLSASTTLALGTDAARHARVCRLAVGDDVEVFDGSGGRAPARIQALSASHLLLQRTGPVQQMLARGPTLRLILCLPRAGKLDDILRMTTELGVSTVQLAVSDYSVGRAARGDAKLPRLQRVVQEALRQSEGGYAPSLEPPSPLSEVLNRANREQTLVLLSPRRGEPLALAPNDAPVALLVGPEGGLSPREVDAALAAGFEERTLGPQILRVTTAAVVGCGLALHQLRGPGSV